MHQAERVASILACDRETTQSIQHLAEDFAQDFDFSKTPPEVATPMYEAIARLLKRKDLYREAKMRATQEALGLRPKLKELIHSAPNRLEAAAKIAVAGNVIDLATQHEYELTKDVQAVLKAPFAVNDLALLHQKLSKTKRLLYLADNAGEHIFDGLYMQAIKEEYKDIELIYMTRESAIINDVTYEEAVEARLGEWATLMRSGCRTPGFIYEAASLEAQKLYDDADIVLAKGMGNFETMSERNDREVFHLFKVKCSVVSHYTGQALGSYMALKRYK